MIKKSVGTFEDRFLAKLAEQPDALETGVTNSSLRSLLGWQEDRFKKTREGLLARGLIRPGVGQGGKTILLRPAKQEVLLPRKLKVFISYSHIDSGLKQALLSHLRPLERENLIESWSDRSIKPGDIIDDEVKKQLETADLFLLLISIDFINSKYCYEKEMARALERHRLKQARVVPIILRSCFWDHLPFSKFKALPNDGKAITAFADQDLALAEVARELHLLAKEFLNGSLEG